MDIWSKGIPGRGSSRHGDSEAGLCPHMEEATGGRWVRGGGQTGLAFVRT